MGYHGRLYKYEIKWRYMTEIHMVYEYDFTNTYKPIYSVNLTELSRSYPIF